MSGENEIKKLLKMRADLEEQAIRLQIEIGDLQSAMSEIDKAIVMHGFRQSSSGFQPARISETVKKESVIETSKPPSAPMLEMNGSQSIQAKDGTVLGSLKVTEDTITFKPRSEFKFMTSTPPFQSFLIERVLQNMRTTDEQKATSGELDPTHILEYSVNLDGEEIKGVVVRNYGGERRLREIQSSFRWSLDKMYDKSKRS
ncbi:MAG: hypothetical protein NTV15_01855 [Candidatus Bathyarchaeota archaeon]|nr:hypothetical protein [Candidatus Bathyarchaeota archaeon]